MLGVDHDELSRLALTAPMGAGGLVLVPYLEGERTPNRPDATGALHGLQLANLTPAHLARAAVEGLLCGLADGLDAMVGQGVRPERVILVGGGARSEAVRRIAPAILAHPVTVPPRRRVRRRRGGAPGRVGAHRRAARVDARRNRDLRGRPGACGARAVRRRPGHDGRQGRRPARPRFQ